MEKQLRCLVRSILSAAVVCTLVLSGCANQKEHKIQPASSKQEQKLFDYQQKKLSNGLDIITLEDFSCPIVAVQIWYHVGAKNENPQRQGFAHMFEHMMFRGTDVLGPTDHFGLLRKVGGTTNGYTSFDRTVYLETLPSNQLELALWLEAERMAFLKIDQNSFNTERKVVEEERRMGINKPYGTFFEKVMAELYKKHPYRWTPIGNIEHLRAASVQELRDFWTKYYVPSNATLVIVGAVKHQDAQKLAEKYFGWIPKYPQPPTIDIKEPQPKDAREIVIKQDVAPAPLVSLIYRTVPLKDKDAVVFDVIAQILGTGNSSRLYRELVAEKQLAVSADCESWGLEQDGVFWLQAVMNPAAKDVNAVMIALEKNIDRMRFEKVTDRELLKAKNQLLRNQIAENLEIESKAKLLGSAAVDMGDISRVNTYFDEIRMVTADDVQRISKKYFEPNRILKIKVEPRDKGEMTDKAKEENIKAVIAKEDMSTSYGRKGIVRKADFPTAAPLKEFKAEKLTPEHFETKLENGLKIMVVTNKEVPFVSLQMGFLNGAWTEDVNGSSSMAMQMLTKGTEKYTEGQLADEMETYAINAFGASELDTSGVMADCLTEYTEKTLELMGQVLMKPTFPADEFDKLKMQVLTGLEISSADNKYIAAREMRKRLYGRHPYSRTAAGEVEDVNRLTVEAVKGWWQKNIRPDSCVLILAGDIESNKAVELAKKTFGTWTVQTPTEAKTLPQLQKSEQLEIYLVDIPASTQSQIRLGQLGITRKDSGYFTSRVVNNYFGMGFNSRLNETIRVKKGLTYNVSGGYGTNKFAGEFVIRTFTKTESTAKTVEALLGEVTRLKTQEPNDKELSESKTFIVGNYVLEHETPQQVAGDLWLIEYNGLDKNYIEQLLMGVEQTKSGDCVKLAQETIDGDKFIVVVTGDAAKIEGELSKIGKVTVVKK